MVFTIIKLVGEIIVKALSLWNKAEERKAKSADKELARTRGKRLLPEPRAALFNKDEIYPFEEEDMAYHSDNTASVVLAFLAGGVVGTALGILFAPKSGKETREDITRGLSEAKEKTDELTQEAVQKFEALVEEAKSKFSGETEEKRDEASEVS